jgi:hypothetical protein
VEDLRRAREQHSELPRVVLVHQGDVRQGEALLGSRWPDVAALADPGRELYAAFGLGRGSLRQVMGPGTWSAGLRALRKGHLVGKPVGDPLVMPGLFLVAGDRILWRHEFFNDTATTEIYTLVAAVRSGS